MIKAEDLEWRMYGLVPYNLSPIQQGIQFAHAVVEYERMLGSSRPYLKWAEQDKTMIILNGGTTNLGFQHSGKGTLNLHKDSIGLQKHPHTYFNEPDLGDQLTAVVFLVDERVWDKKKYPDRRLGGTHPNNLMYTLPETEEAFIDRVGGEKNIWLREFLSQFRLA